MRVKVVLGSMAISLLCGGAFAKSDHLVVGYYPGWTRGRLPAEKIPYDKLTHICHAFADPNPDGTLRHGIQFLYPELIQQAHAHNVKVLLSIGGWGSDEDFEALILDETARNTFVKELTALVKKNGYDGADLDWEYPEADDAAAFLQMVKDIRAAFTKEGVPLLSAAVPSRDFRGGYDPELSQHFDWIGVMTYDFHGTWTDHAGHNAPALANVKDADGSLVDSMNFWSGEKGWPKEKLLAGVPFYGRSFDASDMFEASTGSDSVMYSQALGLRAAGWEYIWDAQANVPYLHNPERTKVVSFEDPASARIKSVLCLEKGNGVIIWALGQDMVGEETPLLDAVGGFLLGETETTPTLHLGRRRDQ